jgi:hypothetical protein
LNYIHSASKKINLIFEGEEETSLQNKTLPLMENAKKIIFLGFGYDKYNMDKIGFNMLNVSRKNIIGTALNYNPRERKEDIPYSDKFDKIKDSRIVPFLRNSLSLEISN